MTVANGNWSIAPNETRSWNALYALTRFAREAKDVLLTTQTGQTDAGQSQDDALREFFEKAQRTIEALMQEARALEQARRDEPPPGRDVVQEASMESFPASDPPAH